MVKNPLQILFEILIGLAQRSWEEIVFVSSKFLEFLQALSYYSTQNLPLAIFSAILAMATTYVVLKYVFRVSIKFVIVIGLVILIILAILLFVAGFGTAALE